MAQAQAMAVFTETFTITSPNMANGTPGQVNFTMYIEGSTTSSAGSHANGSSGRVQVAYLKNGAGNTLMMRATSDPRFTTDLYPYDTTTGWTRTYDTVDPAHTTSVFGGSTFTTIFPLPFAYGTPFDMTFAMLAYAWPGVGSSDVDFYNTAVLNGIIGIDADATITGASGTLYTAAGVVVPEPTSMALLAVSAPALLRRRRPGQTQRNVVAAETRGWVETVSD